MLPEWIRQGGLAADGRAFGRPFADRCISCDASRLGGSADLSLRQAFKMSWRAGPRKCTFFIVQTLKTVQITRHRVVKRDSVSNKMEKGGVGVGCGDQLGRRVMCLHLATTTDHNMVIVKSNHGLEARSLGNPAEQRCAPSLVLASDSLFSSMDAFHRRIKFPGPLRTPYRYVLCLSPQHTFAASQRNPQDFFCGGCYRRQAGGRPTPDYGTKLTARMGGAASLV
jgi:hypothetical protein